ncbi:MAG: type II secretion system F family protein [Clostridia bacterium]|nr:type II secretion system F family protein [Clostridia bacterium]
MPEYRYKALTKGGQVVKNRMEDVSQQNVINRLKDNGLTPISIEKVEFKVPLLNNLGGRQKVKKNRAATISASQNAVKKMREKETKKENGRLKQDINVDLSFLDPIKSEDVIAFTQSLYLLKRADFTNVRALTTLLENTKKKQMRDIVEDILNGVETGEYIYSTMEYYSKVFPEIYVSMIKTGELGGTLVQSLEQALKYLDDSLRIKRSVRKALIGPLFQSILLIIMSVVCILVGLPVMQNLYAQFGVEDRIPPATIAVANFIQGMGTYWPVTLGVIGGLIGLFIYWIHTPEGRYKWDEFKLSMPVFGPLILRLNLQKFFKAMQLNLANGSRLQEAMQVSKNVTSNYVMLAMIETAQANLQVGESWIEPFEAFKNFPPMILEMLRIGMETDMVQMIDKINDFIEHDIEITINRIMKTLPEVATAVMGIILIFFVIIILKPIMEVYLGTFLTEAYL